MMPGETLTCPCIDLNIISWNVPLYQPGYYTMESAHVAPAPSYGD